MSSKKEGNDFMKGCFVCFFRKIIPLFLCLLIVLTPFSVYALDTKLVEDEISWIDRGETVTYKSDDYFQGFSKYIADSDEGCFYFFARFTDYRIDTESDENIALSVTVKNDVHSFTFKVDKDGIVGTSDDVEAYSNFSETSCMRQGGGMFVAFKLKNKADRTRNNLISCEYYCGDHLTYTMLAGVSLDMYVPQTQKTVSDKTTREMPQKNASANNTNPASEAEKEHSTKFSGTGKISIGNTDETAADVQNSPSKFSGADTAGEADENFAAQDWNYKSSEQSDMGQNYDRVNMTQAFSLQSKLLIAVFAVLFSVGIICIVIGLVNKKNAEKDKTENTESEDEYSS